MGSDKGEITMKRYEYKIVALHTYCQDIEEELNKLGEMGWEVYFIRDNNLLSSPMRENPIFKNSGWSQSALRESEYYMEFYLKRIKED